MNRWERGKTYLVEASVRRRVLEKRILASVVCLNG